MSSYAHNCQWDTEFLRADPWYQRRANDYMFYVNGRRHTRAPCVEDVDDVARLWWVHPGGIHDFVTWANRIKR